ncbi:hypothetical protein NM688_g841 [Phlebia brevispora]|uniref:Uncharacterized protein n=1 Tax=Phlebia brevispora TaxID=194682 RepID=A0ACC1TDZ4_9APHY|nr:hypothetical protein NM688_g841 [Phlebia brevispora]
MAPLTDFIAPAVGIMLPLALMLTGVFTVQVYFYLLEYHHDPTSLKVFVIFVWHAFFAVCCKNDLLNIFIGRLVECTQSAFCIHVIHTYISGDFGSILAALQTVWSVGVSVALEVCLVAMIQTFYIYRAWILSKRSWLVAAIPGVMLILRVGSGLSVAALTYRYTNMIIFRDAEATKYTVNIALGLGIAVDVMIAAFLTYELKKTGKSLRVSVPYVQTILLYVIGTGAITANVYCNLDNGLIVIISKLYANTMLMNLNARKHIRNTGNQPAQALELDVESSGEPRTLRTGSTADSSSIESAHIGDQRRKTVYPHIPPVIYSKNVQSA